MERNIGRIWLALLVLGVAVVVVSLGDSLKPIGTKEGEAPFLTALTQLGILYIVALFVERSLEVLIKAWRQGGKSRLEEEARSAEDGAKAEGREGAGGIQGWHPEAGASCRFDVGDLGIVVRCPASRPDLRVRRCGGLVVPASRVSVHRHYRYGWADRRRIGDNPRVDGAR